MKPISTHVPKRICVACRTQKPKSDLTRLAKNNSSWVVDKQNNIQSRGMYVCSQQCLEKVTKRHNIVNNEEAVR